jgi:hypothetical protein
MIAHDLVGVGGYHAYAFFTLILNSILALLALRLLGMKMA